MSFKTLRKRIALVAVAALAVTGLSTVPANAADSEVAAGTISAVNAKVATANTNVTAAAQRVFFGATIEAEASKGMGNNATLSFRAVLTTYPAGGFVVPAGDKDAVNAVAALTITGETAAAETGNLVKKTGPTATALTAETLTATGTAGLGSFTFTPAVVGTYVVTVWNDQNADNIIGGGEAQTSVSITVTAAADLSIPASIAWMTGNIVDDRAADASAVTNSKPRSAIKTAGTYIAQIVIDLQKNDGSGDDDRAHVVSAEISGQGFVTVNTTANTDPNGTTRIEDDNTAASERYVHIEADGTAGDGSVAVYVTHAVTGVKSLLGTWKYTTHDLVTKLEVSTKNFTIGRAGFTTGYGGTSRTAAGNLLPALDAATTVPAFIVKMTDASGKAASRGANPTVVSSNASVVTGGTCALDDGLKFATGDSSSTNGVGFYNCNFTTSANAKSGDKATLTLRVTNPADTTVFISTTVDVTVGGGVSTETISLDKATYTPGEGMSVTLTAKDSAGNPVYDGAASPAVQWSKAVGGTAITAGNYVGGVKKSDSASGAKTIFAPSVSGSFSANATSGNSAGSAISASATVASAVDAQITALVAAIAKLQKAINKIQKRLNR